MSTWINKSLYDLGRFLGAKINSYYHTEGASRHKLYIVIHSDSNTNKRTDSKQLIKYLSEAINSVLDSELVERLIEDILPKINGVNVERVKNVLQYIKAPTLDETKEIMRGLIA